MNPKIPLLCLILLASAILVPGSSADDDYPYCDVIELGEPRPNLNCLMPLPGDAFVRNTYQQYQEIQDQGTQSDDP